MARIELAATLEGQHLAASMFGIARIGSFIVDTLDKTVTYELPHQIADLGAQIHGFVPRGWATEHIFSIPAGELTGAWHYADWQEKNILAGLTYLSVQPPEQSARSLRAQIDVVQPVQPVFEDFVTTTGIAGSCQGSVTIAGLLDRVPLEMEPAQVILARSAARPGPDGRREQEIGCAVRVGGGQVAGLGRIEIQMFGDENPGHIVSMNPGTDFPARMTLDVRKRYVTPHGTFYSDREEFVAENIRRFPPFRSKIYASQSDRSATRRANERYRWRAAVRMVDASLLPRRGQFPATCLPNSNGRSMTRPNRPL
jgi:hypothetical protein